MLRFVEAYEAEGVPIWGLTPQNEPQTGYMVSVKPLRASWKVHYTSEQIIHEIFSQEWEWNTCGWTDESMRDWIKTNLGPTLEAAGLRRLQVMVNDFNRGWVPDWVVPVSHLLWTFFVSPLCLMTRNNNNCRFPELLENWHSWTAKHSKISRVFLRMPILICQHV